MYSTTSMSLSGVNTPAPRSKYVVRLICPDCRIDPPHLREEYSAGDVVCMDCGRVLDDKIIDTRSEWRTFSNDDGGGDDPSRVGSVANPLLNGPQLDTLISSRDDKGGALSKAQQRASANKSDDKLLMAYNQISTICDSIGLPRNISDIAKQLYKKIDDLKTLKGKSPDAIIAACVFIACRQGEVPRTFKEVYTLTRVPKKDIGRIFKLVEKTLMEQGEARGGDSYRAVGSASAKDLMIRFCNHLGLPPNIQQAAQNLADNAQSHGTLGGRSPISIAAAGIYLISHLFGKPKTPKEIADVAGVSEGTIRNAYKYLYSEREKVVDKRYLVDGRTLDMIPPAP